MRVLLFLLCGTLTALAQVVPTSVLMSFPELAFDEHRAIFYNEQWAAVYSGQAGAMFTVPRDSLVLPQSDAGRTCRVIVGNATYSCHPARGNAIVKQDALGQEEKTLTVPSALALQELCDAWRMVTIAPGEVLEEIGPLAVQDERIWFGLIAYRSKQDDPVAGLGWYDTRLDQFGRVYSSTLQGVAPRWLGVRQDSVWMFCKALDAEHENALLAYSIHDANLLQVHTPSLGIPGDTLLNVGLRKNMLMLATEQAVCLWNVGAEPWVWQTDAYAARDTVWTQYLTFDPKSGQGKSRGDFYPLAINQPAQAFARVGDWIELLLPRGIEAHMDIDAWDKRSKFLGQVDWGCGNELCFERTRVASKGTTEELDLLNTPIIFIERDDTGVKVGIQAGWARVDQLVPVLMKK